MFIILGGLPGVGKSTIGKNLAGKIRAVYLRIDSIEQAIKNASQFNNQNKIEVVAEGYMTACEVAKDNLALGLTVIADSVNPIEITRNLYRQAAQVTNSPYAEIEIICSNKTTHKQRVEAREAAIEGLKLPTWQDVLDRDYEAWETTKRVIDTATVTVDEAVNKIISDINLSPT